MRRGIRESASSPVLPNSGGHTLRYSIPQAAGMTLASGQLLPFDFGNALVSLDRLYASLSQGIPGGRHVKEHVPVRWRLRTPGKRSALFRVLFVL